MLRVFSRSRITPSDCNEWNQKRAPLYAIEIERETGKQHPFCPLSCNSPTRRSVCVLLARGKPNADGGRNKEKVHCVMLMLLSSQIIFKNDQIMRNRDKCISTFLAAKVSTTFQSMGRDHLLMAPIYFLYRIDLLPKAGHGHKDLIEQMTFLNERQFID